MFKKTKKILKSPKNRTSKSELSSVTTTVETTEPESSSTEPPTCTKEGCSNEVYVGRSGKIYSLCLVHIQVSYSNISDHQTNSTSTTAIEQDETLDDDDDDDDDGSTITDPNDVAGWTQSILRRPSLASKRNAEAEESIEKQKSFQQPTSSKSPTVVQETPISEAVPNCLVCDEPCYVSGSGKIYAYCGGVVCNNSEHRKVPNNYWEPYYVHQPLGADLAEQVNKFEESQIALDPTFAEQVNRSEDLGAPPDYVPSGEFYSNIFYDQKIPEPLPPGYESEEDSGSDDEDSNEAGQSSSTRKEEYNSK